jgi:uncharacterized protein
VPAPATHNTPELSEDQIEQILQAMGDSFGKQLRSPVVHSPSEERLGYENVTSPSLDGVPLEGWLIRAAGSSR